MKLPAFKISPLLLFATVTTVAIGQLVCGTGLYYTAMMAVTLFSIGIAYNMLGGISTMTGLAFALLALRLVVISQIAKILVFQSAEKYMVNPTLTVSVYAVFFATTVVGVFIYQGVRVPLPHPKEPGSSAQSMILYAVALPLGIIGTIIFNLNNVTYSYKQATEYNKAHSIGLAMSELLLFSIVVAIDHRIRKTGGRHSFSFAVFIPWLVGTLSGVINTQREAILAPTIVYFISCYFRGYLPRRRHYVAGVFGLLFVCPCYLAVRALYPVSRREWPVSGPSGRGVPSDHNGEVERGQCRNERSFILGLDSCRGLLQFARNDAPEPVFPHPHGQQSHRRVCGLPLRL